jgi:hypothetical protein
VFKCDSVHQVCRSAAGHTELTSTSSCPQRMRTRIIRLCAAGRRRMRLYRTRHQSTRDLQTVKQLDDEHMRLAIERGTEPAPTRRSLDRCSSGRLYRRKAQIDGAAALVEYQCMAGRATAAATTATEQQQQSSSSRTHMICIKFCDSQHAQAIYAAKTFSPCQSTACQLVASKCQRIKQHASVST